MTHYILYFALFLAGALADHYVLPKAEADLKAANTEVQTAAEDVAKKL